MKKKSYNPFKMWGSYAGLIISAFIPIYSYQSTVLPQQITLNPLGMILTFFFGSQYVAPELLPIMLTLGIIFLIIGFLIGWGIHSLFRWVRK